jgi:hypothetical protein
MALPVSAKRDDRFSTDVTGGARVRSRAPPVLVNWRIDGVTTYNEHRRCRDENNRNRHYGAR